MAREIPYIQALGEAVHGEMARDDSVIYFGQNLGLTDEDPYIQAFGKDRVRVTPISETAEIGMAPTPIRARAVEEALANGAGAAEAAGHAGEGTDPPSDVTGSAQYRAHLAHVYVRRALEQL